jgi:HlyD family secretion protein
MKIQLIWFITFMPILISCGNNDSLNDATGVFEATEIIVSSEATGKILSLRVDEGQKLKKGEIVGMVDSTQLHFTKLQLIASKKSVVAGRPDIRAQIEATEQEIAKQEFEKERVQNLLKSDVATQKQMDDINAQLSILRARLNSQKSTLNNNANAIDAQSETLDAEILKIEDQLKKCKIASPIDGTVLVKYAEEGEVTAMGKPLFKIADTNKMILRVYITADQLVKLKIGQQVKVHAEFGETEFRSYDGKIVWLSDKSEFTPKTIQTQDERANLVYAVKVAVENDEYLKIGMYGGIKFPAL